MRIIREFIVLSTSIPWIANHSGHDMGKFSWAVRVHVEKGKAEKEILTSQFYIKDNVENSVDGIYKRLSHEQALSVSMNIISGNKGKETTVNIVV